jgi:hypothetical protein
MYAPTLGEPLVIFLGTEGSLFQQTHSKHIARRSKSGSLAMLAAPRRWCVSQLNDERSLQLVSPAGSRAALGQRFPQQKVLENEASLPTRKRRTTSLARYLLINGLRSGFGSDDLIKRVAVRAVEMDRHDAPTSPKFTSMLTSILARQFRSIVIKLIHITSSGRWRGRCRLRPLISLGRQYKRQIVGGR